MYQRCMCMCVCCDAACFKVQQSSLPFVHAFASVRVHIDAGGCILQGDDYAYHTYVYNRTEQFCEYVSKPININHHHGPYDMFLPHAFHDCVVDAAPEDEAT